MKVTIIWTEGGDWQATYVDGVLSHQGHSVEVQRLLKSLGIAYDCLEVDDEYAEAFGFDASLAVTMKAVKKEMPLPDWYKA